MEKKTDINIRCFRFSSEIFGGFLCKINISDNNTTNAITVNLIEKECVRYLTEVLLKYNFKELVTKIMNTNFHIHSSIEEIIKGNYSKIFYICECKKHL
jgi:hypothetical protein